MRSLLRHIYDAIDAAMFTGDRNTRRAADALWDSHGGLPNLTPDDLDWASFGLRQHAKCRVGDNARRYLDIADKLDRCLYAAARRSAKSPRLRQATEGNPPMERKLRK